MPAEEQPLRILIVGGDAFFRRGIREILNEHAGLHVVAEALDDQHASQLALQLRPDELDLVLVDLDMPRSNGFAAAERLNSQDPDLAVVMLTATEREPDLLESVRVGAVGYLSKNLSPDVLLRALYGWHRGESLPLSRAMGQKLFKALRSPAAVAQVASKPQPHQAAWADLTRREKEVCELITQGARDREIAVQLVVSESTVKKHVQNILRKLRARNRAEAVARLQQASLA